MTESVVLMSLSQQGMYFDCQLNDGSDYHVVLPLRVDPIPAQRLTAAVRQVMDEQPALRSAVRNTPDGGAYVVAESVAAPVTHHDLRDDETRFDEVIDAAARQPFDLATAPLFRVLHCEMDGEDRIALVCHHLIADGQSVSLLAERMITLARSEDDAETVPDTGFESYQRKQQTGPSEKKAARQERFWRDNLARQESPDLSHWIQSGFDDSPGRERRFGVDETLRETLAATAREAEVSEYTIYLGAFGLLLAQYAHSDRVSVATPFTDRPGLDMENSIGCFIKTLPVHIDVDPNLSVRDMFERLSREIMGSWKHLDYPAAGLLSEYPALTGVYDVTFIQDDYPGYPDGVRGAVRTENVRFPGKLTVLVERIGGTTELVFQYRQGALSEDKIDLLARRYLNLLADIPGRLDSAVGMIRSTVDETSAKALAQSTDSHYFDWQPAHLGEVFLAKTSAEPDRIAWSDADRDYTNAWAHDAAVTTQHRILAATGGAKQPIAVMLPRGPELLAGLFGTVLAGCAYVPLAQDTPALRVAEILSDASIHIVLTTSTAHLDLPESVIRLDMDTWEEFATLLGEPRDRTLQRPAHVELYPEDDLYIEYTSGSTGKPKGVVVRHANIQNTAMDLERRFPLERGDRYLLKTAVTFDIFGTELYGWLFGDGVLDILPVGYEGDAPALSAWIRDRKITHVNFTPTMLRILLDTVKAENRAGELASLRYVFSGGEALTADIVERFFALSLTCSLENVYGPTEASMWATHTTVTAGDSDPIAAIGTPLNDYRVMILDSSGGLCGIDVPGEICIAGAGVAVGYLNREELTADRFVVNPYFDPAVDPPHMRRMYRTGDLGYLRADGRFAFIRRIDRQVKVGGVRMELGEIEQALLHTDGVVEAAVVVDDVSTPARLAGFFTGSADEATVRVSLAESLLPQMIPSPLVKLAELPRSSAGKLDQKALLAGLSDARSAAVAPRAGAQERVAQCWRQVLGVTDIDVDASFFEQGGNSLSLMSLQSLLREEFGRDIRITELLKHHSVAAQARMLGDVVEESVSVTRTARHDEDIAIIGIGIQVPGAGDVHEFWENLRGEVESITFYDDDELRALGVPESDLRDPSYVKANGRIDGLNVFDDRLFDIPPAEVDASSPQLRLLYKCFWQACEDAGYDPRALPGRVGVFAGGNDDFVWYRRALMDSTVFGDAYQNFTLATNHFLSTRLSYKFDLTGPSLSALSGCSTSLLTVHQAIQSLRTGECDLAVAGGVTVELPNEGGYRYVDGMMLSPDGHCRPFDADAAGTVFSNGAALVLLKPVAAALADGDDIYAVIKGSAVGNDGGRKPSYTAPSEDGQYETIRAAYDVTGIDPATIGYVEAHGTGTLLGDPIEVASLSRVFTDNAVGSCMLGSVKGNVGHTDSAAGSVGLAKVALSLKHRYLPGTRNFDKPNPAIDFETSPFYVSNRGRAWRGERLRAGINSFGVGGTNVHMIVEEAPTIEMTHDNSHELLQFSAASPEALDRTAERVVSHLARHDDVSVTDAARTLRGRSELPFRKSITVAAGDNRDDWVQRIASAATVEAADGAATALLFSGQGNQYHRMGWDLYRSRSAAGEIFRYWMDELTGMLPPEDAAAFAEILYGDEDDGRIDRTEWTQFALFATQYAMTKVLQSFGVKPDLLVGHSIGELTAAALADVWSLPDAARLVRERGKLMQSQPPGVMVAVTAPADRIRRVIAGMDDVWVSLDNSVDRSVLGMTKEAFGDVVDRLEAEGIRGSRLHTSNAFHTPMMTDAAKAFESVLAEVAAKDPSIPIISNRTGQVVRPGQMTDPGYWGEHITEQVRFSESLSTLLSQGPLFGIELGPGRSLATFAGADPKKTAQHRFVTVMRHVAETGDDEAYLLNSLGTLWSSGLALDWKRHDTGRTVSLPGYAFDPIAHPQDVEIANETAEVERPKPKPAVATNVLQGIQDAFQYVLGYREVAPDADFFELGGDSLKATSLSAQLESRLGIDVSVSDIFTSPTPAGLAERFQHTEASTALPKAPAAEDYPLSPAQTRMFLAAKLDPAQLIYNMPSATLLHGTLDPERIRSALRRLVERHEPLRTTFHMRDGEVRQRIGAPTGEPPLSFTRHDDAVSDLDAVIARFVRPFDLATGPLFRMEIVDNGDGTSLLLFDIHHIIADATSVEVLTRDFSQLYTGELDPLPLQYTDFAVHVHSGEYQAQLAESEDALVTVLADPPTGDVLPADYARGEREPAAGRVELRLGADTVAGVKALAETHNATPFMVTLSAWGAVLARYAERDDLVIGAPVTGRTMAETREMAGMFVNLMPIRLRPSASDPFTDYLTESRSRVLDALTRQDVPFERLVERLNLPRISGRHPLFDISFDYHNMDHHDVLIDGISAQPLELPPLAVGMDLVITCVEDTDELIIHLDYAADLYARETIEKLAEHFDVLLTRVCGDATGRLGEIPLYSDKRHEAIRAALTPAPAAPIHHVIAERAADTPEATAVIDASGRHYSYAQLNGMANTQAAKLREAGLGAGDAVALFTVRDVALLVAQLAILKAGGCYVPLDPSQPEARLNRIIGDARPRFAFAPAGTAVAANIETVIDIETCRDETLTEFTGDDIGLDHPIYTVYTSGSTGTPKGISVKHRGVANLLRDHVERELFGPGDVIISLADPTFDIFTFESLIPLACGAAVHMCPVEDQKDAAAIAGRVIEHKVTHVQAPVSKMTAFCGNGRFRSQLSRLRVIVCGGEHFPDTLLTLLRRETNARLFNMYGPTETTVTATVKEFGPDDVVTIGQPISGSAVLIVSDTGMIQPDGVPGELCIAGEGLAAGYPNDPEQTQRAFTTIAELPDVPVYRTGDAGVRLADGDIVLNGRMDHQVKLNGNRIELGEIEKTAMRVDGVSYAVALVDGDDLVLFYTAVDDRSSAIEAEITGSLPVYMKPGRLRRVTEMPRLSNNKIDRNALLAAPAAPQAAPAAPRSAIERSSVLELILAAWREVLGHPVGAADNFFEVGGTSYKLMLVNNRLSEELGQDIPLVRLFENPTPQSLAAELGEAEPVAAAGPAPAASATPDTPQTGSGSDGDVITLDDLAGFDTWEEERPAASGKIAVIGISGTFPGAENIQRHWDNRADGIVSIARFSRDELLESGIDEATVDAPSYVNARGHIAADTFDADFFGYSAKDAETMDPQLRLLHETAWHALEDAGYVPENFPGDIALFAGSGTNFAWMAGFLNRREDPIAAFEAMTMNEKDFLATKVAYKLNLTGPAVNIQTACSTSLVAIHEAVRCLRQGDADMALAGGVALNFPRKEGYAWHEGMIFSPDGVCRPFSDDAAGTVAGQGCGMVLLKPLDRAVEDGDHIYAVIAGSAVNNDGNTKVGYTAPSVRGQQKVIEAALADAGVDADDVGYVETHGTGTKLGDPIEYRALAAVYGRRRSCALGAVKANIGHLDAAAGVAGFIGAVGVLHRGQVPPMANFSTLNTNIEASPGSLHIPVTAETGQEVHTAAVSSFGIGGTNAHVVLQAAPHRSEEAAADDFGEHILPISARTETSRARMRTQLEDFCRDGHSPRDVSYTLAVGRAQFESRAAALAVPGQPLAWLEPTDPPLAVDAADSTHLVVAGSLFGDDSAAAVDFRAAVEDTLTVFDDGLRATLRAAIQQPSVSNVAVERISQFVIRAALVRLAEPDILYAPAGADRLARIAAAFARGELTAAETMRALKSGVAPPAADTTATTPSVVDSEVDARVLRRLLASQWVRHGRVARDRFCAQGRRLPLPGYAFEERRFVSDIRLDELGGASAPQAAPEPQSTDLAGVLAEAWTDILGTEPTDDADFLASGGDSLSAVHLCAMLTERTGITLTVGDIFADPRYRAIAERLHEATPAEPVPATPPAPVAAPPASEVMTFPASPAQKRMYAVCAMQNDTTAYNLAIAYRISGKLDVERLRKIFAALVERHDQLRTSFHLDGGDLVQRVHPDVPDVLSVVELTEEEARLRLDAEPRPFDLASAPLLRVEVLTVAGEARYLLIDMHHIIGDQRSLAILAEDIAEALRGNVLPPPPTRYADYVAELDRLEATGRFDADTEFFVELLRDDIPRLELPTDHTAPETATFDGDRHSFVCSVGRGPIADLARACGATPYLVFLTAITRLLGIYSGQREFVLGTAVSGRFLPGTDRTVGMFVNTLPVLVEDVSSRTVAEAVAASRDRALAVLDHQSAPFEAILSRLDINPGGDSQPLFDVLFNYVNLGTEELELDGVRLEPVPPGRLKSRYALSLSVAEGADDISVDIEYRTELFDAATIARLAGHLDHLLIEMARDAQRSVSQLSLETPDERDRRRAALTATGPAIEDSLLERIRDSFARHADRPALSWEGHQWSYAELDDLTDTLAGGLQDIGVGSGDFVVCLLERGPWQILSRIALLKCGAIEIPLDAATPTDRIMHTLGDSEASIVLCSEVGSQPWPAGVRAYDPSTLTGTYRAPSGITAQTPHVMIYTSGTTGRPKGTLVPQGGLLSTCVDNGYLDYSPGDRILHLTGYTFDPSLLDIYSAFLTGATLVMGSHAHNMDMTLLASLLRDERVDKGIFITAVFHLLMAENPQAIAGMSAVYVGGEAMQPWAAQRAFEVLGPGRIFNLYGPTEASVCTTYFRVDEYPEYVRMPIGVPARNRELYIVHPDGTEVPRGVPGELLVAGPSVAIGYHRRPELTAEKFPDSVGDIRRRLYRTGDRVVLDNDGHIVYLDRIDQQVKHAGYRIELSEIELVMRDCDGVVEGVVVHTADGTDSRLTGFYTGESAPSETDLRQRLLTKLPRYMVPQRLIWTSQLPLTSHGKVDRKRLAERVEPAASPHRAETPADTAVLTVFREVLGEPGLSATDDIFQAGAQSLQAIAIVRRLRESGMDIQVGDIYRTPTAQALSAQVRPTPAVEETERPRKELSADRLRSMIDWTVADTRRMGEAFTTVEAEYGFDMGAVARLHRSSGADTGGFMHTITGVDAVDLAEAVAAVVTRHEVMRARLVGDRFEILPVDEFEGLSALLAVRDLRRVDRTQLSGFVDELAMAVQAEAFDGLLWRCVLVRESDETVRLVWAFHHGVFDGFSAGILTREVERLARGEVLPPAGRYSDFLSGLDTTPDWSQELDSFDYAAWLSANRVVTAAVTAPDAAPSPRRHSIALADANPLELALTTVHGLLHRMSGVGEVPVAFVADCRRWRDKDHSDCVGEFLDAVPVLLRGRDDQAAVAQRLSAARDNGFHYIDSLSRWDGDDETVRQMRTVYGHERGLDVTLVNFQGFIAPDEIPDTTADGPTLAHTHINIWHDDDHLHLEWIAGAPTTAAGD